MANHKGGHFGKILDIDLTTGTHKVREYDPELARKFLGGTGLATYYMWTEIPKGTDPLSPENLLIFSSGPLCGTECPGARLSVNFKSPISGGLGNAYVGGGFTSAMRWAGYDMIIMRGKAPSLSYISIHDDKVEIGDASAMAGKDTFETEEMLKEEIKNPDAYCMVIGPAGENVVPIACIMSERFKAAGRLGGGAVMGSKNIKGVAVYGTGFVPIADPKGFHAAAENAIEMCAKNDRAPGFRQFGTALSLDQNGWFDTDLATRNYQ
ncbi:MAG: aldehyde ferredoxin oxidoreductase N-terminal domain-containing protein, partial [Mailhella sp.]